MRYDNYEINIGKGTEGEYPISAASKAAGETGTMSVTIDLPSLHEAHRPILDRQASREHLKSFGMSLYDALVPNGPIRESLQRTLGRAQEASRGVRIMLAIEPPEVASLPWEYAYDSQRRHWFATSTETLFVRYPKIPVELTDFCIKPPFQVLFVAPQSSGLASGTERRVVESAMSDLSDVVKLEFLTEQVTVERMRRTLQERRFHVVHFVGHAEFRQDGNDGGFVRLDSDSGDDRAVASDDFASLFMGHRTLKLVFLNACEGATVSSAQPLVGIAPELLYRGVPGVIGLQHRVFDDVAIAFAKEFYTTLFRGGMRGMADVAVAEARNSLSVQFGGDTEASAAWGEAVLYLHAAEGMLFFAESRSLASAIAPAETRLNWYAAEVVRERRDVSIDDGSQAKVMRYVRRRNCIRVATLLLLTLTFSSIAAGGMLKALRVDQIAHSWVISTILGSDPQPTHRELILVTTDAHTSWDMTWRSRHTKLIHKLTEAGAAMIVFDVEFYLDGDVEVDSDLADAMSHARQKGTHIIVVADDLAQAGGGVDAADGVPVGTDAVDVVDDRCPHIASALAPVVSGSGVSFVPDAARGIDPEAARSALWFYAEDPPTRVVGGVPGLAFAAYCRYMGVDLRDPNAVTSAIGKPNLTTKTLRVKDRSVAFVSMDKYTEDDRNLRIRKDDWVIHGVYRISDHERIAYEEVEEKAPSELPVLAGRVVFVGPDHDPNDQFKLKDGSTRAGVRFHADIFESLLGRSVGRMPTGVEFALLVVMAVGGALIGGATRRRVLTRGIVAFIALLGYAVVVFFVMIDTRMVLDISYPAAVFILTFAVQMWIEHRWYSWRRS